MLTTRTRSRWRGQTVKCVIVTQQYAGQPSTSSVIPQSTVGTYERIDDNNNPGFSRLSRQGQIVLSDCSLVRIEHDVTDGCISITSPAYSATQVGDRSVFHQLDEPTLIYNDSTDINQIVLAKAFAKTANSDIMTGEFVKDFDQTLSMLQRPFASSRSLLSKMIGRKAQLVKRGLAPVLACSNAWLEYRYGWKPLLMDIDNILSLSQKVRDKHKAKRLVARASQKLSTSGSKYTSPKWVHPVVGVDGTVSSSYKRRCSAGVIYALDAQLLGDVVTESLGLRPRDLVPTAWECLPYSFVVDWFINVGDWLQAVTPVPGVIRLGHWVTNVSEAVKTSTATCAYPDPQPDPGAAYQGSLGTVTTKTTGFARECNIQLQFHPAVRKESLSQLHQLDGLSLMLGRLSGDLQKLAH